MLRSPIAADFTHVDACIDAVRAGTVEAWRKVIRLPVSEAILNHAGLGPLLRFPKSRNSEWLMKMIISEESPRC
jgi:hypothetical protein